MDEHEGEVLRAGRLVLEVQGFASGQFELGDRLRVLGC
jgi:hypothetical protein